MRSLDLIVSSSPRPWTNDIPPLWMAPGKIVVLMDENEKHTGGVLLSDLSADRRNPDSGRILASGVPEIKAGDWGVLYSGTRTSFGVGKYVVSASYGPWDAPKGSVCRFIGCDSQSGVYVPTNWSEHLLMTIDETTYESHPTGFNCLVLREMPEEKTAGGLYIPDRAKRSRGVSEILAMGPDAAGFRDEIQVGSKIVHHSGGCKPIPSPEIGAFYGVDYKRLVWCDVRDVYAVIEDA